MCVVCGLLFGVCCLFVVRCLLFVVCLMRVACWLSVVCCLLFVACGLLVGVVVRGLLFVVRCSSCAVCRLSCVVC